MKKVIVNFCCAAQWLEWLKNFKNNKYVLNKDESLALCNAIIVYNSVAEEFFFQTIKPMCSGFITKIHDTYHVSELIDERDLSTWIFEGLWANGRWTGLRAYRGECSLFSWVGKLSSQIVFRELRCQGIIVKSNIHTVANTSLTLKSMNKDDIRIILDLIEVPQMHDLLTYIYVEQMPKDQIMSLMCMREDLYKRTVKVALKMLKESLISKGTLLAMRDDGSVVNLVSLAIKNVSGKLCTVSSDDALAVAMNHYNDKSIYDEIQEILQLHYPNMEPQAMWEIFVEEQAMICRMSQTMREVWQARYIDKECPESIAMRLGRRRSNVDVIYGRANKILKDHIRKKLKINTF